MQVDICAPPEVFCPRAELFFQQVGVIQGFVTIFLLKGPGVFLLVKHAEPPIAVGGFRILLKRLIIVSDGLIPFPEPFMAPGNIIIQPLVIHSLLLALF